LNDLRSQHILLGVTGGIAAYKAAELVRLLRKAGAEVRVVMTQAARAFVQPLTFEALSGYPVRYEWLPSGGGSAMEHIDLARWADAILVAPASTDFLARLRVGLADDLLATLCVAAEAPIFLAPAMNRVMWEHPATRENVQVLTARGVKLLGPGEGEQACGESGLGRMLEPEQLVRELTSLLRRDGGLAGIKVLVSAGPTREPIDPVRFLSNRSSGKMGYAVAEAARDAGARVTLVSGPVALPAPAGVEVLRVETAAEMYQAVTEHCADQDIYIGAAAVADYTPADRHVVKLKKQAEELRLSLRRTADILRAVASLPRRPFVVGFAAETDRLEEYARSKLETKGVDMIAANRVGDSSPGGFEGDENAFYVCWHGGERDLPLAPKKEIARDLLRLIAECFHAQSPDPHS
jgi:phosphopantothenoylcysteine decarboxylase/phosphopantothenate--cysteine ligase